MPRENKKADIPKSEQQEIVARGEKEIVQAAKEIRARKSTARREKRIKRIVAISRSNSNISLANIGTFPVILCDPPWKYDYAETENRAIENQYPTMSIDDICGLPINQVAMSDAVLFLWTTSPKLEESFRVLSAWGFNYRTCAVWDKEVIGMGYYFRQRHELLLVATRGSIPAPLPDRRVPSVFQSRRSLHSAKPEIVYEIIEGMYPELPKLEMFCRKPREGWSVWGNQV